MNFMNIVKTKNIMVDEIRKNKSICVKVPLEFIGAKIDAVPVMPKMLNRFDPKMAPNIKFACPL